MAAGLGLFLLAAPAGAVERTWDEVADLARQGTPTSLEALRGTTSIEGRAADLQWALDTTDPVEVAQRLRALEFVAGWTAIDRVLVETRARQILAEPRFAEAPAESVWSRIQRRIIEWLLDAIEWVVEKVGGPLPAGILAVAIVAIVSVLIALALGRRRTADVLRIEEIKRVLAHGADPADLEMQAERAAAAGDHSTAVRLTFVSGLLRLDKSHRIDFRAGLTTGEIGQALRSPIFDALMYTFDEVAYGRRRASGDEYASAVMRWQELLK